jgi:hypothetical protein
MIQVMSDPCRQVLAKCDSTQFGMLCGPRELFLAQPEANQGPKIRRTKAGESIQQRAERLASVAGEMTSAIE